MPQFNSYTVTDIVKLLRQFDESGLGRAGLYAKFIVLTDERLELARFGIERYLYFCNKQELIPENLAISEILTDAASGISHSKDNERGNAFARIYYRNNPMTVNVETHSLKPLGSVSRKGTL